MSPSSLFSLFPLHPSRFMLSRCGGMFGFSFWLNCFPNETRRITWLFRIPSLCPSVIRPGRFLNNRLFRKDTTSDSSPCPFSSFPLSKRLPPQSALDFFLPPELSRSVSRFFRLKRTTRLGKIVRGLSLNIEAEIFSPLDDIVIPVDPFVLPALVQHAPSQADDILPPSSRSFCKICT